MALSAVAVAALRRCRSNARARKTLVRGGGKQGRGVFARAARKLACPLACDVQAMTQCYEAFVNALRRIPPHQTEGGGTKSRSAYDSPGLRFARLNLNVH